MRSIIYIISLIIATSFVLCSCFGQMNKNGQSQPSTSDSVDVLWNFNTVITKHQDELFRCDGYLLYRFYDNHKRMKLIETLNINKSDTIFIMESVAVDGGSCISYAWNSRLDTGLDLKNNPAHYYEIDYIRPIFKRWDKKEIGQKGKKKYRSLDGYGNWYITRIIIQPDTLMFDGIIIEIPPHTELPDEPKEQ